MSDINQNTRNIPKIVFELLITLLLLFIFLLSLDMMSLALHSFRPAAIQRIFSTVANPLIGLSIGLLLTAIIQSSSTTTSMTVAFVAAGTLSLDNAIPVIMGANIGTTITCILVSIGHITRKKEFKKAMATASLHNFFNIITALVLLPLEYYTGILSTLATLISRQIHSLDMPDSLEHIELMQFAISPVSSWLAELVNNPLLLMGLSIVILFLTLLGFRIVSRHLLANAEGRVEALLFGTPVKALNWGTFLTAFFHSSSVTISLVIPLVATNRVSLKNAFPFIMGANIGTTFTALIAAISRSEEALSIALVHLLFNVIGVLLIYPLPSVRNLPIAAARALGKSRLKTIFAYLLLTFVILPFVLIYAGWGAKSSVPASTPSVPKDSLRTK